MLSVILAVVAAAAAFAVGFKIFGVGSGILLGVLALFGVFIPLARRAAKRVEAGNKEVESHISAQRIDKAIEKLEALKVHARWQPGLSGWMDAQIGMLRYAHQRDFEGARPFLERSPRRAHMAQAMLAVAHFKKQRFAEMESVFKRAVSSNKKQGLLYAAWGFCELRRNRRTEALAILGQGRALLPKDERLQRMTEALQNDKKPKMRTFGTDWMALHLEEMPGAAATPGGRGGRGGVPDHVLQRMSRGGRGGRGMRMRRVPQG
jgi:hypothetical protein